MSSYLYRTECGCILVNLCFYLFIWVLYLDVIDYDRQFIQAVDKAVHVPALVATSAVYNRIFQDQFWLKQVIQLRRLRYRLVVLSVHQIGHHILDLAMNLDDYYSYCFEYMYLE